MHLKTNISAYVSFFLKVYVWNAKISTKRWVKKAVIIHEEVSVRFILKRFEPVSPYESACCDICAFTRPCFS